MREYLDRIISEKRAKVEELQKRSDESQDLAEVRSIGETLKALAAEIAGAEEQRKKLDDNVGGAEESVPENAELRNAQVVGSFGGDNMGAENKEMEYRQAFMEYILRGKAIPMELRDDANTLTTDVASVIPTVLVNRIIEKWKALVRSLTLLHVHPIRVV